ncbi:hypothetical protein BJ165DRAFT_1523169 [Panaeolus papilionaceus]|nr:hypothetical protein BJ165DRAFT_1523169 [Panaeolus papilionaceus]
MSDDIAFRPKHPHSWSCKFPLRASLAEAIPTEIIEGIIDCYVTNRSMLKTCSLVGKGWHPRSRYHLMSDMFIPDANRRDELLEALEDPDSLLKFTPITGLTATRTAIYSTSRFEGQERVAHHVEDATMRVVQALPDLKYLHLKMYLHIPAPGDECPSNIVQIWLENRQEKLTHLTISNLWLRADDVFPHILALVNLEHLCLHYYSEPNDIELGEANQMVKNACRGHPYPSKLRSLALQGRGIDFLLAYMDRSNPSPPFPLTDLHLEETTRDIDLETLGRLYQSPTAHFRSLNVFGRDPDVGMSVVASL